MASLSGSVSYTPTTHQAGVTEAAARVDLAKSGLCEHGQKIYKKKRNGDMVSTGITCRKCEHDAKMLDLSYDDAVRQVP